MAVSLDLAGRVAVVTGGARGIGRGIAMMLATAGADIAIIDTDTLDTPYNQYRSSVTRGSMPAATTRSAWTGEASPPATPLHAMTGYEAAQVTVKDIQALGRFAMAVKADVSKWDQVKAAFAEILKATGRIDILVTFAGVYYNGWGTIEEWTEDAWNQTNDVNAKGTFLCCKAVIPHMKERKYGRIINISSGAGKSGGVGAGAYNTSKFAVIGLAASLADALVKDGITVNVICPSSIWTQMHVEITLRTAGMPKDLTPYDAFHNVRAKGEPLGKFLTVEDIAEGVLHFAVMGDVSGQALSIAARNSAMR